MRDKQQQYETDLAEAREILGSLKTAYKEHAQGRGLTKRYKIKDREMEFMDLEDLLKQINHWEREIMRLEVATGERPCVEHRRYAEFVAKQSRSLFFGADARRHFARAGKKLGVDLIANPDLALQTGISAKIRND